MAELASHHDEFKMALEWEDDDEVIVKVEPMDEDDELRLPLSPGDPDDLVSTEDWTHFGDISRKCYVNKRVRSLVETSRPVGDVEEISFCIKDDEFLLSKDVVMEDDADEGAEDSSYSLIDLDAQQDQTSTNVDCSKHLLGYFRESENDDDGDSSSSSDDDNRFDTNFSEEATAPSDGNADNIGADDPCENSCDLFSDETGPTTSVDGTRNVKSRAIGPAPVNRPSGEPVAVVRATETSPPKADVTTKKIIYLKRVPKEFVLRNKGVVKPLPGVVIFPKSGVDAGPGGGGTPENGNAPPANRAPIYSRAVERSAAADDKTHQKRSYLRENASIARPFKKPPSGSPSPGSVAPGAVRLAMRVAAGKAAGGGARRGGAAAAGDGGDPEQPLVCQTCGRLFKKRKHLQVHMRIHTGERRKPTKPCPDCGKLFPDNTQLRIHSRVHTGETPFSCQLCDKRFKHQTSLARHLLFHTKERPFACVQCDKTYRTNADLTNHARTHTDERPFACAHCGKRFHDRCAKNTHERIHAEKRYRCAQCGATFAQSTTLKGHMVTHTDERPFECCYCSMRFKSRVVLRSHLRVHTAEKTFRCDHCSLLFTEKRTLMRHVYTHTDKPFPCAFCKRWYFRRDRWEAHVKTHSDVQRPHCCAVCPKRYASKGYLKLHRMKAHDKGGTEAPAGDGAGGAAAAVVKVRSKAKGKAKEGDATGRIRNKSNDLEEEVTEDGSAVGTAGESTVQTSAALKGKAKGGGAAVNTGGDPSVKMRRTKLKEGRVKAKGSVDPAGDAGGDASDRGRTAAKGRATKGDEPDDTFKCDVCKAVLKSKRAVLSHVQSTHAARGPRRKYRKRARKEVEAEEALQCNLCGQFFRHKSTLARHHKYMCK